MASISAEQLIKDLEANVFCRLRPSKVHGVGIFAIRDIPKGADPFKNLLRYPFVAVDADDIYKNPKIDPEVKKLVDDMYSVEDGKLYLYGNGLNAIDISFFLNHSETPNIIAVDEGESFVAARNIKKGEELFSDHRTYSDNFVRVAK